ncbi:hypothetical protein FYJ43_04070 [Cutibacterium sp. WCA-380-WT-3A]|uniref:Uncharacterized protein n=1 Tax=Cutibacterium porci TaxID=2605781 RepID=A0A7K0J5P3_9ACTN|nr:hypothetical protein [Cutibacterium porci]MSS45237.1 hypothetical protein [Cutibacterium porci]
MWWMWVLVFAVVLLIVEVVGGTIWLWRKLAGVVAEVGRVTGRLDEFARILEDVGTTAGKGTATSETS